MSVQDPELTVELARDVLGRVAPEEMPLFPVTSEMYQRNPGAVEAQAGSDEVLGFGAEVITAMTPVVLAVAGPVVDFLLDQVRGAVAAESQGAIRTLVRRLFSPASADPQAAAPIVLTREQLRAVREIALERARALRVPDGDAELLADAMVGGLATA